MSNNLCCMTSLVNAAHWVPRLQIFIIASKTVLVTAYNNYSCCMRYALIWTKVFFRAPFAKFGQSSTSTYVQPHSFSPTSPPIILIDYYLSHTTLFLHSTHLSSTLCFCSRGFRAFFPLLTYFSWSTWKLNLPRLALSRASSQENVRQIPSSPPVCTLAPFNYKPGQKDQAVENPFDDDWRSLESSPFVDVSLDLKSGRTPVEARHQVITLIRKKCCWYAN